MPRASSVRRSDDDEPEEDEAPPDEAEEEEEEEPAPRRRARAPPRRNRRRPPPAPVRRWRASEDEEEEGEDEAEEEERPAARRGRLPPGQKPVYWRARDSLWFEPLVALAIIVVLLVSLYAYTQNWPPVYVVESDSMQHGPNDQLGLINTGDLVLAQKVPTSSITPYVTGLQTGYSTYGEYGDVILYWPDGGGSTPIIHRALLYLEWDPAGSFYNATDLSGLPCGGARGEVFSYTPPSQSAPTCDTTNLALGGVLDLYNIGWLSEHISIDLTSALGDHSGFLTMGDANAFPDQVAPIPISTLVEPGWIIGVARGMIPWFGSIKLLLEGQTSEVPAQSWQFMSLTIVGIIAAAYGIHYALRTEGIETPLRREEDRESRAEAEAAAAEAEAEGAPRGWLSRLRHRHPEEEEEAEPPEKVGRQRTRPPPSPPTGHRGRPAPRVRRNGKPAKKRSSDDEL